jgi:aquaporin Z
MATTTAATPAQGGWHWGPWLCELFGTATLLAGGLSAVFLDFGPSSPVAALLPSTSARLLLTGLLFAGTGSLVALSPLGRRSGAHLNPSVTLAFWTQRKVHPHDLAGYILAQLVGALTAGACLRLAWGNTARTLHLGTTQPGHGFSPLDAATLVWQGAPSTGTSLNPARSIAPALLAPHLDNLWVYIAGPSAGALLAAAVFAAFRHTNTLTAKLFHDPRYPSTLASALPTAIPPSLGSEDPSHLTS